MGKEGPRSAPSAPKRVFSEFVRIATVAACVFLLLYYGDWFWAVGVALLGCLIDPCAHRVVRVLGLASVLWLVVLLYFMAANGVIGYRLSHFDMYVSEPQTPDDMEVEAKVGMSSRTDDLKVGNFRVNRAWGPYAVTLLVTDHKGKWDSATFGPAHFETLDGERIASLELTREVLWFETPQNRADGRVPFQKSWRNSGGQDVPITPRAGISQTSEPVDLDSYGSEVVLVVRITLTAGAKEFAKEYRFTFRKTATYGSGLTVHS